MHNIQSFDLNILIPRRSCRFRKTFLFPSALLFCTSHFKILESLNFDGPVLSLGNKKKILPAAKLGEYQSAYRRLNFRKFSYGKGRMDCKRNFQAFTAGYLSQSFQYMFAEHLIYQYFIDYSSFSQPSIRSNFM